MSISWKTFRQNYYEISKTFRWKGKMGESAKYSLMPGWFNCGRAHLIKNTSTIKDQESVVVVVSIPYVSYLHAH